MLTFEQLNEMEFPVALATVVLMIRADKNVVLNPAVQKWIAAHASDITQWKWKQEEKPRRRSVWPFRRART